MKQSFAGIARVQSNQDLQTDSNVHQAHLFVGIIRDFK